MLECLTDAKLNTASGCFAPAVNAALSHRLSRAAGKIIDPAGIERIVSIGHPGHLTLACADIRTRYIFSRAHVLFSYEFGCKSARDFLELLFVIFFWIEA